MRLAVYVPTYEAESTVGELLERTAPVARRLGALVLVQDDASTDRTVARAEAAADGRPDLEVVRNPVNLGYGGNLKRATAVLQERGFAGVAMLHGDLQYRPEDLPSLVAPIVAGRADLVLGSRLLGRPGRGEMPRYKWTGNRLLTAAVNRRFHTGLTDPHTGFVAFTMSAARALRLPTCADGHEITADMCLRALRGGLRIEEVAIPTTYGPGSRSCSPSTSVRYGCYLLRSLGRPRAGSARGR